MTAGSGKPVSKTDIPEHYRWRLEDIYESDHYVGKAFNNINEGISKICIYKGKLSESADILASCLSLKDILYQEMGKLYVYSHLRSDEDNGSRIEELKGKIEIFGTYVDEAVSFIEPEIADIDYSTLGNFCESNNKLLIYKHYIDDIKRHGNHILPYEIQRVVSYANSIASTPENVYNVLCNADLNFPKVKDISDNDIEISEGSYKLIMKSGNRALRKNAFTSLYSTYGKYKNTFAALLDGNVKKDVFYCKILKHSSCIDSVLFEENIPFSSYKMLIDTVNQNIPLLHKYMKLKKDMLGCDTMHIYDIYAPSIDNPLSYITFDECCTLIEKALEPLGNEYISILSRVINSRWIDVFSHDKKSSGAYSWGVYGIHPFILLNYNGLLDDVFTTAHEIGHSIHFYLTMKSQPYINSHYSLLTAETAAEVNEILLFNYSIRIVNDKKKKMFLICQFIENIIAAVFRQGMLSEFEYTIHQKSEKGVTLTSDCLCSLWHDLCIKYYGPDVCIDDEIDIEWARISHFYRSFYAYKYIAGFSSAAIICKKIMAEGESAARDYLKFLKSGDSDYPSDLLKSAGVDIASAKPAEEAITMLKTLLNKLQDSRERYSRNSTVNSVK